MPSFAELVLRGEVEKNTVSDSEVEIIRSTFEGFGLIKWDTFISHRLPLLNLPTEVLEALRQGQIEYTKATAIATFTHRHELKGVPLRWKSWNRFGELVASSRETRVVVAGRKFQSIRCA